MTPKTNVKKPDRMILFEIGIILALLFVNWGLSLTYSTPPIPIDPPDISIFEDPSFHHNEMSIPEPEPPTEQEKIVEKAAIFDPRDILDLLSDLAPDELFETKPNVIAPTQLTFPKKIAPISMTPKIDSSKIVEEFAQVMPQFPGGSQELAKYIRDNYEIPDILYDYADNVEIVVEFIVNNKGKVSKVEILKCTQPGVGAERSAQRLYKNMPIWAPGENNGEAVNVRLRQPIKITIH